MHLLFHGGKCCGVKTIYNLGINPAHDHSPIAAKAFKDSDACGHDVTSKEAFFHEGAPKESGEDRLVRYIKYMETWRPRNILEATIAISQYDWVSQELWRPVLLKHGFTLSIAHPNSNSGNIVEVYHKAIGDPKVHTVKNNDPDCDDDEDDDDD